MRLLHYESADGTIRVGFRLGDGRIADLASAAGRAGLTLPTTIDAILAAGLLPQVLEIEELASGPDSPVDATVRVRQPLLRPGKIIGIGANYEDHASETAVMLPPEPIIFAKFGNSVCGPTDSILLPTASQEVDWEAELVAVIGRGGKDIAPEHAQGHVAGYTVGNDLSARDWQLRKPLRQWTLGKTFDTFLPLGPELVTPDEIADPYALRITCDVSGERFQDAISAMHFRLPELISYVSRVVTLEPGDLILTGTPSGTGIAQKPPRYLQHGDVLVTAIEGLGVLTNAVRNA